MARSKVKLAWIANKTARQTTMRKRYKSLIKKLTEISTLCGVQASLVAFTKEGQSEIWPSLSEARLIFDNLKSSTNLRQNSRMMNQESFLAQKVSKFREQLRKEAAEVRDLEMNVIIHEGIAGKDFSDLAIEKAAVVSWALEDQLKKICNKIVELESKTYINGVNNNNNNAMFNLSNNHHHSFGQEVNGTSGDDQFLMNMNMDMDFMMSPSAHSNGVGPSVHEKYWINYKNVEGGGEHHEQQQFMNSSSSIWI